MIQRVECDEFFGSFFPSHYWSSRYKFNRENFDNVSNLLNSLSRSDFSVGIWTTAGQEKVVTTRFLLLLDKCPVAGDTRILSHATLLCPFTEAVDYDPNSQTVRLDISLRRALGSLVVPFNSVNNFKVEVLKLPGNCSQPDDRCGGPTSDAAVVQSRRLCLGDDAGIRCDQKIPAGRVNN